MDVNVILIYSFLLLSVIAIWTPLKIFNKIPLWLFFLAISFVTAMIVGRASFLSFFYTVLFGFSVYYYYKQKNTIVFFIVLALSIPLISHFTFLNFNNYKYLSNISLTNNSIPFNLYLNLDKTLVGLFIIAFSFENKKINFKQILKLLLISLLLMMFIFFVLTTLSGFSKFEPKLPSFTPVWILTNLFSTCIAEEALFRRLIQQKIHESLNGKFTAAISILVASLLFGFTHFQGGIFYIILASFAGMCYGYIYYKSKRIESSILLHFAFNLTHLLLFTYPALK